MKVIIIGAGIAGLTSALACHRAGFEVKIFEKTNHLQNIGGGILLWPYGIRYLDWLGLSHCLDPYWVPVNQCHLVGHDGKTIFSEEPSHFLNLMGGKILPIERNQLQHALLKELPDSCVHLGKSCVNITEDRHEARVYFADGTEESADLVIGADGIHSKVRKIIGNGFEPEYTGFCWWGGIVAAEDVPNFAKNESYFALGLGKVCIVWPVRDNKFMWYLPVKMPVEPIADQKDACAQLQSLAAHWNSDVQQLIAATLKNKNFQLPIYALSPPTRWSTSRITLIGDAAHAMAPILAQGTSLAIEDAFVLAECLQNKSANLPTMLRQYEALRREKYQHIEALENQSSSMMLIEDIEILKELQQQMQRLNLSKMYSELIPLINEKSSHDLLRAIDAYQLADAG